MRNDPTLYLALPPRPGGWKHLPSNLALLLFFQSRKHEKVHLNPFKSIQLPHSKSWSIQKILDISYIKQLHLKTSTNAPKKVLFRSMRWNDFGLDWGGGVVWKGVTHHSFIDGLLRKEPVSTVQDLMSECFKAFQTCRFRRDVDRENRHKLAKIVCISAGNKL